MNEFDEECLNVFLENQSQLFEEAVAETLEDAEAFLEDCMAVVVENIDEVKEFLEEEGMDIQGDLMRNWKKQQKCSRFRTEDI